MDWLIALEAESVPGALDADDLAKIAGLSANGQNTIAAIIMTYGDASRVKVSASGSPLWALAHLDAKLQGMIKCALGKI